MLPERANLTLTIVPEWVSRDVVAAGQFVGRLGRHIEHDARSLTWTVDRVLELTTRITTKVWDRYSPILNQGDLGSCTGNAMCGLLACAPHVANVGAAMKYDETFAVQLYELATQLDNFPGTYPPDDTGSSGLAVAKAARELGEIRSYLHATTTRGFQRALMHAPAIIGINWYDSFDTPDERGILSLTPDAQVRGGHELLVRGWDADHQLFVLDNSWGSDWGANGSCFMPLDVWERLRRERADVTIPVI